MLLLTTVFLPTLFFTGSHLTSVSQQRAKYISQMQNLLADMGRAVRSVTHLTLRVNNSCYSERKMSWGYGEVPPSGSSGGPPPLPPKMFELLAAALPNLKHLSLGGDHHSKVSLSTFVALSKFCLLLTGLSIETGMFDEKGLADISHTFRRLTKLTIKDNDIEWVDDDSPERAASFLCGTDLDLSSCSKLTTLVIDCGGQQDNGIICWSDFWKHLPKSLTELQCNGNLYGLLQSENWPGLILNLPDFMENVRVLTLVDTPGSNLPLLLKEAPHLERLTVTGNRRTELLWNPNISLEQLLRYKDHLLGGFVMSLPHVKVTGPSDLIRDEMGWIPPLLDTTYCAVTFPGDFHVQCLDQVVRLFPNLMTFAMGDHSLWADDPQLSEEFLNPLIECNHLEKLEICVLLKYTNHGVLNLITSLPALVEMRCMPHKGFDATCVMKALEAMGRKVVIIVLQQADFPDE